MTSSSPSPVVLQRFPLAAGPWPTVDPFLFCVHHVDHYPASDGSLTAPEASLVGRNIGNDFSGADGWSMYHGSAVPGFPQHPHRGFETVTFTKRGFIDHADSLGASARYGNGDVQWLTAGAGVVHAEMFPLLNTGSSNDTEFFQIWLNLPKADKMAEAFFTMLWAEDVPVVAIDSPGGRVLVTVAAGTFAGPDGSVTPGAPPPDSYGSKSISDLAIWRINFSAGSSVTLPPCNPDTVRTLYVSGAGPISIDVDAMAARSGAVVDALGVHTISAGTVDTEVLVLQGRPIGEPVAQYGPFVMNDRAGIEQAFADYQRTQFGGWPWPVDGPTHGNTPARFAKRPGGALDLPPGANPVG